MRALTIHLPDQATTTLADLAQAECRSTKDQASYLIVEALRGRGATRHRVTWTADRDGQAHAAIGGRPRTPCGRVPLEPRYGWPETQPRCPECLEGVAPLT